MLATAQAAGRRTRLVNTVWQENGPEHDAVLRRCEAILTRGPRSSHDLRTRHGIGSTWHLDLSYFAPLNEVAPPVDFGGATVVTDFWQGAGFPGFVRPTTPPLAGLPYFDLAAQDWDKSVAALRTAGLVITGRHHVIYAAAKARVPFVAIAANSHKIEDLIEASPVRLPVCRTLEEVRTLARIAPQMSHLYTALFDWMERQPPPDLLGPPRPPPRLLDPATARDLAARADRRAGRARAAAEGLAAAIRAGRTADPPTRIRFALEGGRGWDGAETVVAQAIASGRLFHELRWFPALGEDAAGWTEPAPADAPAWWALALQACAAAGHYQDAPAPGTAAAAARALEAAPDAATREAARVAILARAIHLWRPALIRQMHAALDRAALPPDWVAWQDLRVSTRLALFTPEALDASRAAFEDGAFGDERIAGAAFDHLWLGRGASGELLAAALALLAERPEFAAALRPRAAALAIVLGDSEAAQHLMSAPGLPAERFRRFLAPSVALGLWPAQGLARMWNEREERSARIAEALGDRRLSVAIVGNGPAAGPGDARAIDAHDIVVRINDFRLTEETGTKVDLVATGFASRIGFGQPELGRARLGSVLTLPVPAGMERDWAPTDLLCRYGHVPALLPDRVRARLQDSLGVPPSAGLHLAALAAHLRGGGDGLRVFCAPLICGRDDRRRLPGGQAHERHDWEAEAALLRGILAGAPRTEDA